MTTTITLGPTGGQGGNAFNGYGVPEGGRITAVHVFADHYIDALQIVYVDAAGNDVVMPKVGGEGGEKHIFALQPDEFLIGISGQSGWYVDKLVLHTNKRTSPAYGGEAGYEDFKFLAPDNHEVVGFFGRAAWFIDQLGVACRPRTAPKQRKTRAKAKRAAQPKELQKVEGIGPKIAGLLAEAGILDLDDLAQVPVARLEEILAAAGRRYAVADPTTWPEQAALGARGDWEALTQLQATLNRGRRID